MLEIAGYIKTKKIFRHHWKEIYIPVYKDIGKGASIQKIGKKDLKKET